MLHERSLELYVEPAHIDTVQVCATTGRSCLRWVPMGRPIPLTLRASQLVQTVTVWGRAADGTKGALVTLGLQVDGRPPIDGSVSATAAEAGVVLEWEGYADFVSGIDHYEVVYAEGTAAPYCSNGAVWTGSGTTATLGNLRAVPTTFRVCAVDAGGLRSNGSTVTVTPVAESDAPDITEVTLGDGSGWTTTREVTVNIVASDASELTRQCVDAGSDCTAWTDYTGEPTTVDLEREDVAQQVTVKLRDVHGNEGVHQQWISLDREPPVDGELSVSVDEAGVTATWTAAADSGSGLAEYVLEHIVLGRVHGPRRRRRRGRRRGPH